VCITASASHSHASFNPMDPAARCAQHPAHVMMGCTTALCQVVKRYAAMIDALSMVIVNLQGDFQHMSLGPAIAAYVSLMNLKEAVGMERAIVGGMLASKTERFTVTSYSDLVRAKHFSLELMCCCTSEWPAPSIDTHRAGETAHGDHVSSVNCDIR
jgi:hypothetical protein